MLNGPQEKLKGMFGSKKDKMKNTKKTLKAFGKKLGVGLTHEEKKARYEKELQRLAKRKELELQRKSVYDERMKIRKARQRARPKSNVKFSKASGTPLQSFVGESDITFSRAVLNSSVGSAKKKKKGKKGKDIMSEIMRM